MEKYLNKIVDYIENNPVRLTTMVTRGGDGRVDSTMNEDEVIAHLKQNTDFGSKIQFPGARAFYDFEIVDGDQHLYVNVKVSDLSNSAADNCSSKEGLGYALTGMTDMPSKYPAFHKVLLGNLRKGYDYYFLVVNKNDHSDAYWTSLKRIKTLVSNGNNLPFQCDWATNREFSDRTEEEAIKYLLEVYLDSWRKRLQGFPIEIEQALDNNNLVIEEKDRE